MIDLDNSFLRLRNDFEDAKNLNESPMVQHEYVGQVSLIPGETYLQISNSPTDIVFNSNYEVFLVDSCGKEIINVTLYVYIKEFLDSNGISQIAWEFIDQFDYPSKVLMLRFRNTDNGDTWWTNPFVSTSRNAELTTRFDYKNNGYHYGTQYNRANYYQSIRLNLFYKNDINESERQEYYEVSTTNSVPQRNNKKIKQRYLLLGSDAFTERRIETIITSNELYVNGVRNYSTTPLEFTEPVMDSNVIPQNEMILNPDFRQIFTFAYQIFEGIKLLVKVPLGYYTLDSFDDKIKGMFNIPIQLNTGTLTVFDASDDSVVVVYNQGDMFLSTSTEFTILNIDDYIDSNGSYYIQMDAGLISAIGIPFQGIQDKITWTFIIGNGQFNGLQFNNSQFFTN